MTKKPHEIGAEVVAGERDALNGLLEASRKDEGHDVVLSAMDRLIAGTREHFAREEQLMLDADYPDYELHKRLHAALLDEIADLRKRFHAGEMEVIPNTSCRRRATSFTRRLGSTAMRPRRRSTSTSAIGCA